jgi:hypothetical protein
MCVAILSCAASALRRQPVSRIYFAQKEAHQANGLERMERFKPYNRALEQPSS